VVRDLAKQNLEKPSAAIRAWCETGKCFPSPKVCLLDNILGLSAIAQHCCSGSIEFLHVCERNCLKTVHADFVIVWYRVHIQHEDSLSPLLSIWPARKGEQLTNLAFLA
jgi:hypothetical protein